MHTSAVAIARFISYQISPSRRTAVEQYAGARGRVIPRYGGSLPGCLVPTGTNDVVRGLIRFERLGAYEVHRVRPCTDPEECANFESAALRRLPSRRRDVPPRCRQDDWRRQPAAPNGMGSAPGLVGSLAGWYAPLRGDWRYPCS